MPGVAVCVSPVVRAAPQDPFPIANRVARLDARYGIGLTGSDVTDWADSWGALDMAEATFPPEYDGSAPGVVFDSANDERMETAAAKSITNVIHDGTGMSLYMVFTPVALGTGTIQVFACTCRTNTSFIGFTLYNLAANDRLYFSVWNGSGTKVSGADIEVVAGRRYLLTTQFSTAGGLVFRLYDSVVGLQTASDTIHDPPSASDSTDTFILGRQSTAAPAAVKWHDWMLYSSVHAEPDRTKVETEHQRLWF